MHITLTPLRHEARLSLHRAGEVLTINGQPLDLSVIPEGATLPAAAVDCPWLAGEITRQGGEIHLTVLLPHGPIPWPAPPEALAVTHPAPLHVAEDGPIALPDYEMPDYEIEEPAE